MLTVYTLLLVCGPIKLSESGWALSGHVCLLWARDNDKGKSGGSKSNM